MSDDQFTRLYTYMQDQFSELRTEVASKSSQDSVDRLTSAVDSFAKTIEHFEIELAARDHKINRLEKYIEVLAKKVGVDLDAIRI